jgi:RNA-directed DNA polymerase
MRKRSISLQELREKIYVKAKAEPQWRFWGMFTHLCKLETLKEGYKLAKKNNGAPGVDGVTFEEIEAIGVETYVLDILQELLKGDYKPMEYRTVSIPKTNGKKRILKIPTIRDRIVQGALKLILEPIFETDFQEGSYGFRPNKSAHDAIKEVDKALHLQRTTVIDLDLSNFFDNIRHHILFEKVATRINDPDIMHLLKLICKTAGKKGVPQGGVISPLLANIYLNDVDKMLEKANKVTGKISYARYADDLVVLVMPGKWVNVVHKRLLEEFGKLQVAINQEKSKIVDMEKGESFIFLGFEFKTVRTKNGKYRAQYKPDQKARNELIAKLKVLFRKYRSQPIKWVIEEINPILRGWVNYFRIGNSKETFAYIKMWVDKKIRRHLMRAKKKRGFGWKRWSKKEIVKITGVYYDYRIRYLRQKALPHERSHKP